MAIQRDRYARVRTENEARALAFFGFTKETADVTRLEPPDKDGLSVFGVIPKDGWQEKELNLP